MAMRHARWTRRCTALKKGRCGPSVGDSDVGALQSCLLVLVGADAQAAVNVAGGTAVDRGSSHREVIDRFTMTTEQCGEQNAALKSRAFAPRTAAEARRAEAVVAKRLAQRFVLGARSGRMY